MNEIKSAMPGPQAGPLKFHPLSPKIYWVEGGIGNCGFIIGEQGVITIDATISPETGQELLAKIAAITPKPVTAVILTHGDFDHIGGLAAFPAGLMIIAHEDNKKKMESSVAAGHPMISANHLPNRIVREQEDIEIEGVNMELLHWAPAHTAGDLVVYFPEERIVFSGDIFCMDQPVALIHREQQGSSDGWLTSAKGVAALDADRFVVGHGDVQTKESLQKRIGKAESEKEQIKNLVAEGISLQQIQDLIGDPPPGWNKPGPGGPRFTPFSEVVYQELIERKMSDDNSTPTASHDSERKLPPRRPPIQIAMMDTSQISRKWLDLTYGIESPSQSLDIYLPEQGDGPFPLIVAIHGGAFLFGDKADVQALPMMSGLHQGYAVASINYRLSGEAKFPAPVQDCKSAIRFLRINSAHYHLDPDKIAVWGGSAGGYLSAMLGTSPMIRELDNPAADLGVSCAVQAVVDWCGPTENFIKMDEEFRESGRGIPDHSDVDSPESRLMGAKITEIPELVRKASPMTYITENVPPFLIQHGELDHKVPMEQSIEFAGTIARIAGAEKVTFEVLPGVAHHGDPGFETEENVHRVLSFLDQCLLSK